MLTLQALQDFGAHTKEGMTRCLNNEQFYFRLIKKALDDSSFEKLRTAIEANDLETGFETAHALKGVMGNLALTPLYQPISEMTELLRSRTQMDYSALLETVLERRKELLAICAD